MDFSTNISRIPSNQSLAILQQHFFQRYFNLFIIYVVLASLICLFGVASNTVCLIAICTYQKLKKRGNILVANLVLINILLGLTVHPTTFIGQLYGQYHPMPVHFCSFLTYYFFLNHALIWQECFVALNRFVAIIIPHRYKVISSLPALTATIFAGYLLAFFVNFYPLTVKHDVYAPALPFGGCSYAILRDKTFPNLHMILGTHLPMGIIGACYLVIFTSILFKMCKNKLGKKDAEGFEPNRPFSVNHRRIRLALMLFGSFLWYMLTNLPHPILSGFFGGIYLAQPPVYLYVRLALQIGVAGNAVIYTILNVDYRTGIKETLKCRKSRIQPDSMQLRTTRDWALSGTA